MIIVVGRDQRITATSTSILRRSPRHDDSSMITIRRRCTTSTGAGIEVKPTSLGTGGGGSYQPVSLSSSTEHDDDGSFVSAMAVLLAIVERCCKHDGGRHK